ncbi:MAG: ferritin family protein [Nitrospirae bacterium]|nr:ferritin family protein [Nitrospirota bacterium]
MFTGKEDLLQVLIEAFLMEKGTRDFYSQAAQKAINSKTKNAFKELSRWEEQHMDFIQFLYQSIQDNRDVESFKDFKNRTDAPVTEAGIPVKDLETKLEGYNFIDDMGALIMALEMEGKAYNLYRRLSRDTIDNNARVVFQEMMEQESKHIDYLKKVRLNLSEIP